MTGQLRGLSRLLAGGACAFALTLLGGCESPEGRTAHDNQQDPQKQPAQAEAREMPPFGGQADIHRASSLWNEIKDYDDWSAFPGMAGWQEGQSPHGKYLRYYLNTIAAEDTDDFEHGAVIVKVNYSAKHGDALKSVTVMKKIRGYDPDNANWFWVKYSPEGEIMANKKDMKLAGRVAKGTSKGCIHCHGAAAGGDYVFAND